MKRASENKIPLENVNYLKDLSVVILSSIEWNFLWQRHQTLATKFAEYGMKVIFVESSVKRNPDFKDIPRIIERLGRLIFKKGLRRKVNAHKNITIISPVLLPATYRIFRWGNRKFFIPMLKEKIKRLGAEKSIILCYLPTQTSLDLINMLNPIIIVYDCVDNLPADPAVSRDLEDLEKKLVKTADLTFVSSSFLYDKISKIRKDVIKITHGVDFELFRGIDKDRTIVTKRVAYFGSINEKIDFRIIKKIALKGYEVYMIGPIRIRLPKLPKNVIFAGTIAHKDLSKYLRDTDCLIIPYRINLYMKGVMPAKLFECFATGKPIIVTPLPVFSEYKEFATIAKTPEEFVRAIKNIKNIETNERRKKRIALARENSWDNRFEKIVGLIANYLRKKGN